MLPLKLIRSLVLGETINNRSLFSHDHHHHHNDPDNKPTTKKTKTPLLLFLPTRELVTDTYRLATIARDMGMDLYPTPSLSHIIFSNSSSSSPSTSTSTPCPYSCASSSSSSSSGSSTSLSSWYLPKDAVPLPFPSLSASPLSRLRSFVSLSKGLFKLVFITTNNNESISDDNSNWDCCSFSLFSRLSGDRIDSMDSFARALAGKGWTLFKTRNNPSTDAGKMVYLFRKVDSKRVQGTLGNGEWRIRELRLPTLDFRNTPLRIFHYIILMTDDLFYLA